MSGAPWVEILYIGKNVTCLPPPPLLLMPEILKLCIKGALPLSSEGSGPRYFRN